MKQAICSKRVVTMGGLKETAVVFENGKIEQLVPMEQLPIDCPLIDYGNAVIYPGMVDAHVHLNEPGRTEWEGFETGTRAAAAGGITTVVDMPLNSLPVTTNLNALWAKQRASEGKLYANVGLYAGYIPGSLADLLPLLDAGVLGVKIFLAHSGIEEFPNTTEKELHILMPLLAERRIPLLVHAELEAYLPDRAELQATPRYYDAYLASRPDSWELEAIEMMIRLCDLYQCPVHIVHLSTGEALPMLAQARAQGLPITVETAPHYLYFAAEEISNGETLYKCAPPIRGRLNRERLWEGLANGIIDFIASDHSPAPAAEKMIESGNFFTAWGGISSVQLVLPIVWTAAKSRGFSIAQVSRWLCSRPAQFLGIGSRKGTIAPGFDADLFVWEPEESFIVEELYHKHPITPYMGFGMYGKPVATYVAGVLVEDGKKMGQLVMGRQ